MKTIQRRVFVSGKVQAVGFRAAVIQAAGDHEWLRGFVRNLKDGRVEAVFQGDDKQVKQMVEFCRTGPPSARVTAMVIKDETPDPALPSFGLRPDA